jgi:hypothetical protein
MDHSQPRFDPIVLATLVCGVLAAAVLAIL